MESQHFLSQLAMFQVRAVSLCQLNRHLSPPPANFKKKVLIPDLAAAWTRWTLATLIQHVLMTNARPVLQGELISFFKYLLTHDPPDQNPNGPLSCGPDKCQEGVSLNNVQRSWRPAAGQPPSHAASGSLLFQSVTCFLNRASVVRSNMRGVRRRLNEACRLPRSPVSLRGLSGGWSVKEEGRKEGGYKQTLNATAAQESPPRLVCLPDAPAHVEPRRLLICFACRGGV